MPNMQDKLWQYDIIQGSAKRRSPGLMNFVCCYLLLPGLACCIHTTWRPPSPLQPGPKDNGNAKRPHYWLFHLRSLRDAIDLRSRCPEGRMMHPKGGIMWSLGQYHYFLWPDSKVVMNSNILDRLDNGHWASAEESQNSWAVCPCTVCLVTFCETSFEFAELAPHWGSSFQIWGQI